MSQEALDIKTCELKDKLILLFSEEESLINLKKETAAEFRAKITEKRAEMKKVKDELAALSQLSLESQATVLLDSSESTTASV